jgi:hypothetical protein
VNGNPLPTADSPLPPNLGVTDEAWAFSVEAHTPTGEIATDFNGYVAITVVPGAVDVVTGTGANGRNILLQHGTASGVLHATGVYGPAQLWVQDLGYLPAPMGKVPQCSNGLDDNGNGLIDYPADPGCYYADDDSENGGTYSAGVSPPVNYALPKISDVRGQARTPFPNESVQIAAKDPQWLVVTRVSESGFFVTDLSPFEVSNGYNSLYAYNFSTPANMQVCDRIVQLSGTANDFYGFTQLSFPSFQNTYTILGADGGAFDPHGGIPGCRVPEPTVLQPTFFTGDKNTTSAALYPYEAGLVRLEGFTIATKFGSKLATNQTFGPGQSNCDFNGNGQIDYTTSEGVCATTCDQDPTCSEWTAYASRSQYKVSYGSCSGSTPACASLVGSAACTGTAGCDWNLSAATMILVNTSTVSTFNPVANAGATVDVITGSLTEFSGGTLNWTVEARCPDDLVCAASLGCTTQSPVPMYKACVAARTIDDNDQGTN